MLLERFEERFAAEKDSVSLVAIDKRVLAYTSSECLESRLWDCTADAVWVTWSKAKELELAVS